MSTKTMNRIAKGICACMYSFFGVIAVVITLPVIILDTVTTKQSYGKQIIKYYKDNWAKIEKAINKEFPIEEI